MRYSVPTLVIYVPRMSGRPFLVQRYMEHPQFGFSQATGDAMEVSESDMVSGGDRLVERLLADYPGQTHMGASLLGRMSAAAKRKHVQEYAEVCVSLEPQGRMKVLLIELDTSGDSGTGRDADAVYLDRPFSGEQLMHALRTVASISRSA